MIRDTQAGTIIVLQEYDSLKEYSLKDTDIYEVGPFENAQERPDGVTVGQFTVGTRTGRPFKAFGSTRDYNDVIKLLLKMKYKQSDK